MHHRLEDEVQQLIRMEASKNNILLFRNNVGAFTDTTGRTVRFGLGNDSVKISQNLKSSDLVGITPILITPNHVGTIIGVFTAIECKREDWNENKKNLNSRESAQKNFIELVRSRGGIAGFANSIPSFYKIFGK